MPIEGVQQFYLEDEVDPFGNRGGFENAEVFIQVAIVASFACDPRYISKFEVAIVASGATADLPGSKDTIRSLVLAVERRFCLQCTIAGIFAPKEPVELTIYVGIWSRDIPTGS